MEQSVWGIAENTEKTEYLQEALRMLYTHAMRVYFNTLRMVQRKSVFVSLKPGKKHPADS